MNSSQLMNAVLQEVQLIPVERLPEVYRLLRSFRLQAVAPSHSPIRFAGCWNDLPDEIYADLIDDISSRRQQAFSERRTHEASLD